MRKVKPLLIGWGLHMAQPYSSVCFIHINLYIHNTYMYITQVGQKSITVCCCCF